MPESYIRAFSTTLSNPLPGNKIFKLEFPDNSPIPESSKLFICGEWKVGHYAGPPAYIFYDNGWYVYYTHEYIPGTHPNPKIHVIVVPVGMDREDCYSRSIFTHTATAVNTVVPEIDHITSEKDHYATYIDDIDLKLGDIELNDKRKLRLIVTREGSKVDEDHSIPSDTHHFAVWYDPILNKWAIVYPSRNPIRVDTKFNVMVMHDEVSGWDEPGMKHAFAFQHHICQTGGAIPTNINTTSFEKAKSEKLLEENHLTSESPTSLIVVVTEELDWLVKDGVLRPNPNIWPLSVWFTPSEGEVAPPHDNRWAVYTNLNGNIDPEIKMNVCTRLPCPDYCNNGGDE